MLSSLIDLAPFAAVLALLYLMLTVHVVRYRYRYQLALGVHADEAMQRAIRAHANFAEYAPFGLLLITLVALLGGGFWVMVLGALLVIGRVSHAYSILSAEPRTGTLRWRLLGMICTVTVFVVSALFLLWQWGQSIT